MIWFYCEDDYYYNNEYIKQLKKEYQLNEIIKIPTTTDEVLKHIGNSKIGVIAPFLPKSLIKLPKQSSLFNIIKIKNFYEPFTKEQIERKMDKSKILSQILGVRVYTPTFTFDDYAGAEELKNEARKIELKFLSGLSPKGFLILGLPGTGKSFFCKCYAGETKRIMIELNFSKILEDETPLLKLEQFFDFLRNNPNKYLVWIDEIEKMFNSDNAQQILGVFLTELNEFNSSNSNNNVIFIATANNIQTLRDSNPELFRTGGRFDKIIMLMPPTEENAIKIFSLYFQKQKKIFKEDNLILYYIIKLFNFNNPFKNTNMEKVGEKFYSFLKDESISFQFQRDKYQKYYDVIFNNSNMKLPELNNINLEEKTFIEKLELLKTIIIKKFWNDFNNENNVFIKEKIEKLINELYFSNLNILIKNIVNLTLKKYRNSSVDINRFPYTQAEISYFSQEFYANYFFNESLRDLDISSIIEFTLNNVLPLQNQMNDSLKKMYSSNKGFLKI